MLKSDIVALPLLIAGICLALMADDITARILGVGCMFYGIVVFLHGDDVL